jgi:heptosyltransferase-2
LDLQRSVCGGAAGEFSASAPPGGAGRERSLVALAGSPGGIPRVVKPKLLVLQLWQLGDLAIASPFLRAASAKYEVTLVAKPYAGELRERFWPEVKVFPFVAPWTAFKGKYHVLSWPWREIYRLQRQLSAERFAIGLSARWDPRDHVILALVRARARLGFPRVGSGKFLTRPLARPEPEAHVAESWRALADALGLELPPRDFAPPVPVGRARDILVHTGARHTIRVWPLERYRNLVLWLRGKGYRVQVACDASQKDWWQQAGEREVAMPATVTELLDLIDRTGLLVGNDSGPGHLAALAGVPTFSIFGPQLPEWFVPVHPKAVFVEGKACPYKPCADSCRFREPVCITRIAETEVLASLERMLETMSSALGGNGK